MLYAKCVIYVKNAKNAIFDAYAIRHMSYIDMAIWVSKDALGPQECRQMPLNNLWISLTAQIFKILTLEIFLCMFWNFLWIMWGARGRSSTQPRELKFLEEFYITIFNGKISLANSESNSGFFWPHFFWIASLRKDLKLIQNLNNLLEVGHFVYPWW